MTPTDTPRLRLTASDTKRVKPPVTCADHVSRDRRAGTAPGGVVNVFGNSGVVSYGPNGFRRLTITGLAAQPQIMNVLYCDDRGNRVTSVGSTARVVRIDQTGRGQTLRDVATVTPAIADIPGAVCP